MVSSDKFSTQKTIDVQVEYYDDNEIEDEVILTTAAIEKVVQSSRPVSSEEFLTYYLFYRKRPGKPGYTDYRQLRTNVRQAFNDLDGWIVFNGTSILAPDAKPQDIHVIRTRGRGRWIQLLTEYTTLRQLIGMIFHQQVAEERFQRLTIKLPVMARTSFKLKPREAVLIITC